MVHQPDSTATAIAQELNQLDTTARVPIAEAIRRKLDSVPNQEVLWNLAMVNGIDQAFGNMYHEFGQTIARAAGFASLEEARMAQSTRPDAKAVIALAEKIQRICREQLEAALTLTAPTTIH